MINAPVVASMMESETLQGSIMFHNLFSFTYIELLVFATADKENSIDPMSCKVEIRSLFQVDDAEEIVSFLSRRGLSVPDWIRWGLSVPNWIGRMLRHKVVDENILSSEVSLMNFQVLIDAVAVIEEFSFLTVVKLVIDLAMSILGFCSPEKSNGLVM